MYALTQCKDFDSKNATMGKYMGGMGSGHVWLQGQVGMSEALKPNHKSRWKRWRKIVLWVLPLGALYWAFSYYVFIPICMDPSKPITLYLESNKEQQDNGAIKRVTLRVPSAYLINHAYAPRLSGGKQEFISLQLNIRKNNPACLTEVSRTNGEDFIYIHMYGISTDENFQSTMSSQRPKENEKVTAEDGFVGFRKKGSLSDFVMPKSAMNKIFFDCIPKDDSSYQHRSSGCSAWTTHKGMGVKYGIRRSQLPQWQKIEKQAFNFVDSMIVDIEQ